MSRAELARRIRARELTVAPGVYDMVSARLADQAGFDALFMSGYGVSASTLGLPDAGLATFTDMVDRARTIVAGVSTPLIADADTGFGGLLNVDHTVRGYDAAGVAAIQLEDQEFPKQCGHSGARPVISRDDMVRKIEVALAARTDPDFLIIARTDARTGHGLDDAIERGQAFAAAGADVVFVESPQTEDEFRRIAAEVDAPLVANMVEGGATPILPAATLGEIGFTVVLYPGSGLYAAAAALRKTYQHLRDHADTPGASEALLPVTEMHSLLGFEDVWAFDERWAD